MSGVKRAETCARRKAGELGERQRSRRYVASIVVQNPGAADNTLPGNFIAADHSGQAFDEGTTRFN
jgi:hypothetical protein